MAFKLKSYFLKCVNTHKLLKPINPHSFPVLSILINVLDIFMGSIVKEFKALKLYSGFNNSNL